MIVCTITLTTVIRNYCIFIGYIGMYFSRINFFNIWGGQLNVTHIDICRSSNSKTVTTPKLKNVIRFIVKKRTLHRKLYTQEFLNSRCKKIKLLLLKALYFSNFLLIGFEMTLLIFNYQENIYYI